MSLPAAKVDAAPILSAGWVVELLRCTHLDDASSDERWFAVNLIAPQGGATDDWTKEEALPDVPTDVAIATLSELLFPWRWAGPREWRLYGRDNSGAWRAIGGAREVSAGTPEVVAAQAESLRLEFEKEVKARTAQCESAFSLNDPRWEGHPPAQRTPGGVSIIEQSLVHALIAPTHAPVTLSNDVFRYAGFLKATQVEIGGFDSFVAFPRLTLGTTAFEPGAIVERDDGVVCKYTSSVAQPFALVFKSFQCPNHNDIPAGLALRISAGSAAREVVLPLFAAHGLPLEMLANALANVAYTPTVNDADGRAIPNPDLPLFTDPVFPRKAWLHVLVRQLGSGWFRRRSAGTRPHVLEYASSGADLTTLRKVFPGGLDGLFCGADTPETSVAWLEDLTRFAERAAGVPESPEHAFWLALQDLLEPIDDFLDPPSEMDLRKRYEAARRFFQAWTHVALSFTGDGRADVFRGWLEVRIRHEAERTTGDKTQVRAVCERLEGLLTADTADRILLGALDEEGLASVWALLDELVDANEVEAEEARVIEAIQHWCWNVLKAALSAQALGIPSTASETVATALHALWEDFKGQGRRLIRREFDEGLIVRFENLEAGVNISQMDRQIRGFAVALQSGVRPADKIFKPDKAAWVTQTAILAYGAGAPRLLVRADGSIAEAAGTVGSASRDGQRIVQFPYRGDPVFAAGVGVAKNPTDEDDFHSLDFRWPIADTLPVPGFGAEIKGVCTPVDNAGGIVLEALRDADFPAVTCSIEKVEWPAETLVYRSCVPPGAPLLIDFKALSATGAADTDPWELSHQTRAARYAGQKLQDANTIVDFDSRYSAKHRVAVGGALPRVACVAPHAKLPGSTDFLYGPRRPCRLRVTIAAPHTTKSFVRSWLATDCMLARAGVPEFSDPNFSAVDATALAQFMRDVTWADDTVQTAQPNSDYHPAVSGIGIELYYGDRFPVKRLDPILLQRTEVKDGRLAAKKESIEIEIAVDPASAGQPVVEHPSRLQVQVSLPPGCFVRVRCYSLVSEASFAGDTSTHRFFERLPYESSVTFAGHRAFGPYELWTESLPLWEETPPPRTQYMDVWIDAPTAAFPERQRLMFAPAAAQRADWIRAVEINRHSWHWTGYPVRFPPWSRGKDLRLWLPAFAGVESNREQQTLELPTYVDRAEWKYGDATSNRIIMHEHRLIAGERPSRYAAYTLTPLVRFAQWLNPALSRNGKGPAALESDIFAAGNVIDGVGEFSPTRRMAAPAFEHRIPLTATYSYEPARSPNGLPLTRSVNGDLLIFNDAVRRTDRFARLGGLGDTIEVDLLQTREVKLAGKSTSFMQSGPNPLFHKSPSAAGPNQDNAKPALKVSEPHGLTYDLVRNAKVAQTAILVQPAIRDDDGALSVEKASGQWQLAQVRVRRLVLPETQLNSALPGVVDARGNILFPLQWRQDGVERVPTDFAVDLPNAAVVPKLVLHVDADTSADYPLDLPTDFPSDGAVRMLVSFHKDRWDPQQPPGALQGMPYWAPQVLVQRREPGTLTWTTVSKSTCHGKSAWVANDGRLRISVAQGAEAKAYAVQMSDYTDARWLLFLGRVPGTGAQPPEEYVLTPRRTPDELTLHLTRGTLGPLTGPPKTETDWESDSVEFFLLFVSSPPSSVLGGTHSAGGHGLLAFEPVTPADPNGPAEFRLLGNETPSVESLEGSTAVLFSFHRVSATSANERKHPIDSLESLIAAIFPENDVNPEQLLESLVRPTGSHWGPMRVGPPE